MRIVFAGTPEFASTILRSLLDRRHQVVGVFTQLDRPAGRGRRARASPVKKIAQSHHIALRQPGSLRDDSVRATLGELTPDVVVVAAYGLIVPGPLLAVPRLGFINVHASRLPRWRGAAPIQRAILSGDDQSGVTIMQMDEGLDTGKCCCVYRRQSHPGRPRAPYMTDSPNWAPERCSNASSASKAALWWRRHNKNRKQPTPPVSTSERPASTGATHRRRLTVRCVRLPPRRSPTRRFLEGRPTEPPPRRDCGCGRPKSDCPQICPQVCPQVCSGLCQSVRPRPARVAGPAP